MCGLPLHGGEACHSCRRAELPLKARSYGWYEGSLKRALLHLKYRPNRRLAVIMAEWLAEICLRETWKQALIVPVPLGGERLRQRGYNQADLIGSALSKTLEWPFSRSLLRRVRETVSQVGLDAHERQKNVQGAFCAAPQQVVGKMVVLVDDLYTTGATLSSCTQALVQAGAALVFGVTVARAHGTVSSPGN